MRFLPFFLVATLLMALLHRYVWARFVRDTKLPKPYRKIGTILVVALFVTLMSGFVVFRSVSRSISAPLSWIAFTWLGVLFFLAISLGLADLVRVITLRAAPPKDPDRRLAISRMFAGAAALVGLGTSTAGVVSALSKVEVKKLRVAIENLTFDHAGYRIVQLSDVHVGPTIGKAFIRDIVDRVNALKPDLVVITGDLVDGSVAELREHVAPLADLVAREGVFFVTGNHDHYSGADEWVAHLATLKIRSLRNDLVQLPAFDLAGVEDASSRMMDLDRALEKRRPGWPCVLLAHQPKGIEKADVLGVDLQLSGHTHGGQLFPWGYLVRLQQPFVQGLHKLVRAQIYVSRGTGYWGPPMRVLAPAEITEIELTRA